MSTAHTLCCLRAECAMYYANINSCFFEYFAAGKDPTSAAATFFSYPFILAVVNAIYLLQCLANLVLNSMDHIGHFLTHVQSPTISRSTVSTHSILADGAKPCPKLKMWPGLLPAASNTLRVASFAISVEP